jgi:hypothetical protein
MNPFRDAVVADPWNPSDIDVYDINANAFNVCWSALERVNQERRSTSVLLFGEAGSGKTHLLGRLQKHLRELSRLHVFVSVSLQSSPGGLWRHIRRCFVESLLKIVGPHRSQLELIFVNRLNQLIGEKYVDKKISVRKLRQFMQILCRDADLSWNLGKVIEHLLRKNHPHEAVAWLKGDPLPDAVYRNLDLVPSDDEAENPEDRARTMVKEFCRLAGPDVIMVVSFDQVEAIQRYPGDHRGIFSFGQAIQTLHDETGNVLLVSCIQSFFMEILNHAMMKPNYDRLAAYRGTLNPLTTTQAIDLIADRLENSPALFTDKDKIFQTLKSEIQRFVGPGGETARSVLSRCADLFDAMETGGAVKGALSEPAWIKKESERRKKELLGQFAPESIDDILLNVLPTLVNVMKTEWRESDGDKPLDVDIILTDGNFKTAISLCNHFNMNRLSNRLKRLGQALTENRFDSIVLIRHPEMPVKQSAKQALAHLDRLQESGARFIQPETEILVSLAVFKNMIGDARAGDLTCRGQPISEEKIRRWIKGECTGPVGDFLQCLLPAAIGADQEIEKDQPLMRLVHELKVVKLADAAEKLGYEFDRLHAMVRDNANCLGYLEGPPAVIFQYVAKDKKSR